MDVDLKQCLENWKRRVDNLVDSDLADIICEESFPFDADDICNTIEDRYAVDVAEATREQMQSVILDSVRYCAFLLRPPCPCGYPPPCLGGKCCIL